MAAHLQTFAIAVAIGLLLGFEREHRQWREHGEPTSLGTRTLGVLSLLGALARTLDHGLAGDPVGPASPTASATAPPTSAAWITAAGLVVVAAMLAAVVARSGPGQGTTTASTAPAAYLLGALAVDDAALAVAAAALLALVLESKPWVRRAVREVVSPAELEDAIRWFVLAFVVLPLMPDEPVGPSGAIVPSRVWTLVLLLTAIGWLGYIATRATGRRRGLLVVGATGGFVSGAATTAALARLARRDPALRRSALGGALLASVATCAQVVVLGLAASPSLGRLLVRRWPRARSSSSSPACSSPDAGPTRRPPPRHRRSGRPAPSPTPPPPRAPLPTPWTARCGWSVRWRCAGRSSRRRS